MALTPREILESTDLGAREVFTQLPVTVALWSRWSRLVVDLNRDFRQVDPKGVVPEVDYYGRDIYKEDCRPEESEVKRRLKAYYWPYHNKLKEAIENPEIKVLFDCHSLENIGPPGAPDPLRWRKNIVLGNNGDPRGGPDPALGDITCPAETLQMMMRCLSARDFPSPLTSLILEALLPPTMVLSSSNRQRWPCRLRSTRIFMWTKRVCS